jgi:multiple sugar transport system substrate-binding protein
MLKKKTMAFPSTLNENDEIPALGDNKAAMIISGPWMQGEMKDQYPNVSYTILPLPAGPTGIHGTLTFTNCWGVAAHNDNLGGTIEFVKFLTTPAQELRFTKAFGPIPSLKSAASTYEKQLPQDREQASAILSGHPDIEVAGSSAALSAFDSALTNLATQPVQNLLGQAQQNLQEVINQNNAH